MWVIVIMILILIYFIPSVVADYKKNLNSTAIFIVNLFFGWTIVGWVIALTMAVWNSDCILECFGSGYVARSDYCTSCKFRIRCREKFLEKDFKKKEIK